MTARMSLGNIVYSSAHIPAEWVSAQGFRPCRIIPRGRVEWPCAAEADKLCIYAKMFLSDVYHDFAAGRVRGVLLANDCAQMSAAYELLRQNSNIPAFHFEIPRGLGHSEALDLYMCQLWRLNEFLSELGGQSCDADVLTTIMSSFDASRYCLKAAKPYLSSRQYTEAILEFGRDADRVWVDNVVGRSDSDSRKRLALVGSAMTMQDLDIFDIVERYGGRIVLDGSESGERGLRCAFVPAKLGADPIRELGRAYLHGVYGSAEHANDGLYEWLRRNHENSKLDGVIIRLYENCHAWSDELDKIRAKLGLPVLDIQLDNQNSHIDGNTAGCIRDFVDSLG